MHQRKQLHDDGTAAPSATEVTVAASTSDGKKKERRRRKLEIPTFILLVFTLLAAGLLVTGTLYLQTPDILVNDLGLPLVEEEATATGVSGKNATRERIVGLSTAKNEQSVDTERKRTPNYHVLFSTSCNAQMHWESYVLFYHAMKIKQPGNVTRLLAGCPDKDWQLTFHEKHIQPMSPNFHVHLTPDFSHIKHHGRMKQMYKYLNKPHSLRHWLENVLGYSANEDGSVLPNSKYDDDIVFLIDPDMILLQPLTHDFRGSKYENVIWVEGEEALSKSPDSKVVRHGHPFSQQDGYLSSSWVDLDIAEITLNASSPALSISKRDGPLHWNSGPPYILTARDAYRAARLWTEYVPRVHKQFPELFAEMYGYVIATAHLNLSHTFVKSLVVSTTITRNREGWALVDQLPDESVCPFPEATALKGGLFALHYCKRYLLGRRTFWSKYRVRKDILECEAPLLEVPDPAILSLRESMGPPPVKDIQARGNWTVIYQPEVSPRTAKREGFMLCGLISKTNEALEYHKRQFCPEGSGNYSKVYSIYTDPG